MSTKGGAGRREIVQILRDGGLFLTSDAFEVLNCLPDTLADEVVAAAVTVAKQAQMTFIDRFIIELVLSEMQGEVVPVAELIPQAVLIKPQIQFEEPRIRIAEKPLEGYIEYFRSRYEKIARIFAERGLPHVQIARLAELPDGDEANVVGMVREKRETKGKVFIDVEDLSGSASLLIPQSADENVREAAGFLVEDIVCAFTVRKNRANIVKDVILPEVPFERRHGGEEEIYAVITSDMHFGSKSLIHPLLNKFERWLKGECGDEKQREIARRTKYIIVAGDLVEGIGVYPEQLGDLEVANVRDQYEMAASYFARLPAHIEIIVSPGNHDATQQALPQPSPSAQVAPGLYRDEHVHPIPNPCVVSLHGVKVLVYHGQAVEDIAQRVAGIKITEPVKAMEYMLKVRHMAPIYGGKTPIAPQMEDNLVIREVPHVFVTGHVHVFGCGSYRGVVLVGAGTWQKQTDYQVKMGINPTPGIVAAINLRTLEVTPIDLNAM